MQVHDQLHLDYINTCATFVNWPLISDANPIIMDLFNRQYVISSFHNYSISSIWWSLICTNTVYNILGVILILFCLLLHNNMNCNFFYFKLAIDVAATGPRQLLYTWTLFIKVFVLNEFIFMKTLQLVWVKWYWQMGVIMDMNVSANW